MRETLAGVVAARALPVAIRPLVISGGVKRRSIEPVEIGALLGQQAIGAGRATRFGVADMDDEVRLRGIDRLDQPFIRGVDLLWRALGHVPEDHDGDRLCRANRCRENEESDEQSVEHDPLQH